MSRSGYVDNYDSNYYYLYRAIVERTIAGKRGQKFLIELASALDAMSEKKLIRDELVDETGQCCTIGVFCKAKQIDVSAIDYEDAESVGKAVGIPKSMAAEIEYENDEHGRNQTPEERWTRMRRWVADNLKAEKPHD